MKNKKLLALFICILLIVSIIPAASAEEPAAGEDKIPLPDVKEAAIAELKEAAGSDNCAEMQQILNEAIAKIEDSQSEYDVAATKYWALDAISSHLLHHGMVAPVVKGPFGLIEGIVNFFAGMNLRFGLPTSFGSIIVAIVQPILAFFMQ